MIDRVYSKIENKEIWILFREAEAAIGKQIDRLNRKIHIISGENGVTITIEQIKKETNKTEAKQSPMSIGELLNEEVKEFFFNIIKRDISLYINQTGKKPPNKIRDSHLKNVLRNYNVKLYKKLGYKISKEDCLILFYDKIKDDLLLEYKTNGQLYIETKREALNKKLIVIETKRMYLRNMHFGDFKEIKSIISDINVMYAWERTYTTKEEIQDWIKKQCRRYKHEQVGYFLAIDKINGKSIGQIGLMWDEINVEKILEIGYILKKSYWQKGYATEGADACLKYGFELFDISEIYATIRPENTTSIAVAKRLGMKLVGEFNKEHDGKIMKHLIYSIKKE